MQRVSLKYSAQSLPHSTILFVSLSLEGQSMFMNLKRTFSCKFRVGNGKQDLKIHPGFPTTFNFLLWALWE